MRNVSLSMASTDLVFILDADFVPSAGYASPDLVGAVYYSVKFTFFLCLKGTCGSQIFKKLCIWMSWF